ADDQTDQGRGGDLFRPSAEKTRGRGGRQSEGDGRERGAVTMWLGQDAIYTLGPFSRIERAAQHAGRHIIQFGELAQVHFAPRDPHQKRALLVLWPE